MNYFVYTSHHFTSHGKIWTQLIDLAPKVWLHSSVGRASHRYRGGHGFESRWSPDFFRLLFSNCLNWKINCDDHSSLPSHVYFTFLPLSMDQTYNIIDWQTLLDSYEDMMDLRSKVSNLSNWKKEAWKNQGFNGIRTRDLREYRCDAPPTELWSHRLGARSINWVHIFPYISSSLLTGRYELPYISSSLLTGKYELPYISSLLLTGRYELN